MHGQKSKLVTTYGVILLVYSLFTLLCTTRIYFSGVGTFYFLKLLPYYIRSFLRIIMLSPFLPLMGVVYLIASFGVLKRKNWGRSLVIYFSLSLCLFSLFIVLLLLMGFFWLRNIEGPAAIAGLGVIYNFGIFVSFSPAFIFLFLFVNPKIKSEFVSDRFSNILDNTVSPLNK